MVKTRHSYPGIGRQSKRFDQHYKRRKEDSSTMLKVTYTPEQLKKLF